VTNLVQNIVGHYQRESGQESLGLNLTARSKLGNDDLQGTQQEESEVIIRNNELLKGVFDKNQLGSGADYGFIHGFHELYGPELTGKLISALAKVTQAFLQMRGHTCGLDDLIITHRQEIVRREALGKA